MKTNIKKDFKKKNYEKKQDIVPDSLFGKVPREAEKFLENIRDIIQNVRPLNIKQNKQLLKDIKELSHQLTDERIKRKISYMNIAPLLTAYAHYFLPWNLYRLTNVFSAFSKEVFTHINDESVLLDLGSGPLTVPIALWLARPELRSKKLTFYCVDLSQNALSLGEEIFLSAVAATATPTVAHEPWKIVRVRGSFGVEIRQKADFVFCVNMCNEFFAHSTDTIDLQAQKFESSLQVYAKEDARFFVAEPGIPQASRFISLVRNLFLQKKMTIEAPCPHEEKCPMDGKRGGKWCHFVLSTENAPKKLQKLSESAGLQKDRATISFVLAAQGSLDKVKKEKDIVLRIASDIIKLPQGRGRYACSKIGLVLITGKVWNLHSGTKINTPDSFDITNIVEKDKKSGATIIRL